MLDYYVGASPEHTLIIPGTNLMAAIHPNPVLVIVVPEMLGGVCYTSLEGDFALGWVSVDKVL